MVHEVKFNNRLAILPERLQAVGVEITRVPATYGFSKGWDTIVAVVAFFIAAALPTWSKCRWVSTTSLTSAGFLSRRSKAFRIFLSLPGSPVSTKTSPRGASTRYVLAALAGIR